MYTLHGVGGILFLKTHNYQITVYFWSLLLIYKVYWKYGVYTIIYWDRSDFIRFGMIDTQKFEANIIFKRQKWLSKEENIKLFCLSSLVFY